MTTTSTLAGVVASGDLAGLSRLAAAPDFEVDARDGDGKTPLLLAARAGQVAIVQFLLDRGADIDAVDGGGYSALFLAVHGGDPDVVRALLARGANAAPPRESPLIAAAREGKREMVELLVAHGAPIESRDHLGAGPLHKAAYFGHRDVVAFLLDHGADVHARDKRGVTPLHGAALNVTDPEVIHDLIARGARIDDADDDGNTPLDFAEREGEREVMQSMKQWAATP